jgi:cyclophilin family peptidyl-prolyl cis-trans isomerase
VKRFLLVALLAALGCGTETAPADAKNPVVIITTSMGTLEVELFEDKSPITVKNFLGYVDDKFYDGTIFHRVMGKENSRDDFMIQGGGFGEDHKEKKTKESIKNESTNGLSNKRGTLAMARTPDPNSATAQFFINVKDNDFLDAQPGQPGYAVFGRVIKGLDVVDKIKAVKTTTKIFTVRSGEKASFPNAPVEEVVIKSIRRAE